MISLTKVNDKEILVDPDKITLVYKNAKGTVIESEGTTAIVREAPEEIAVLKARYRAVIEEKANRELVKGLKRLETKLDDITRQDVVSRQLAHNFERELRKPFFIRWYDWYQDYKEEKARLKKYQALKKKNQWKATR